MNELLFSPQFWFGAVLLGMHQIGRFSELSASDQALSTRSTLIPNLRASDFASRFTFGATLVAFLAVTFLLYLVLCLLSPTILEGWAQVSGAAASEHLEKFVKSVPYPLFVAATFMGLTQPAIPMLSRVGDMQRNLFHSLMGVPKRVVDTSNFFANQILAQASNKGRLAEQVLELVSDSWLAKIDGYVDSVFYRYQLTRLRLDDEAEVNERLKGSKPELRNLIGQLVYAAALATVRDSGGKSLGCLAADLNVSMPPKRTTAKDLLAGGILLVIGTTFLWSVIPMFDGLATRFLTASPKFDFWPDTLASSGQYVMVQIAPILIAVGVALATWSSAARRRDTRGADEDEAASGIIAHFQRYAGLSAAVVIMVVAYDLFQAFFDYGYYQEGPTSFWTFVKNNVHFYLLHAFIAMAASLAILLYVDNIDAGRSPRAIPFLFLLTGAVGLSTLFYAVARLYYQFEQYRVSPTAGSDYVVLTLVLTLSASLLAFAMANLFCRRRIAHRNRDALSLIRADRRAAKSDADDLGAPATSPAPARRRSVSKSAPAVAVRAAACRRRSPVRAAAAKPRGSSAGKSAPRANRSGTLRMPQKSQK